MNRYIDRIETAADWTELNEIKTEAAGDDGITDSQYCFITQISLVKERDLAKGVSE